MSELRFNALRGEEVVYAIHRQERTFLPSREHCPLCPTRPGGPQTEIPYPAFEIAVFENRFPALQAPQGAAEVIVYTDQHEGSLATLSPQRAEALMWVWRHRYAELGAQVGLELADGRRVVYESERLLVYVPYAARWAYEAHVVLRTHRASLLECEAAELSALASALQALVRGYDALFARPFPYVMVVHQQPTGSVPHGLTAGGHVHVEYYPPLRAADKLKFLAGSEQGAGTFIADTVPEESAAALREAIALGA